MPKVKPTFSIQGVWNGQQKDNKKAQPILLGCSPEETLCRLEVAGKSHPISMKYSGQNGFIFPKSR